MSSKRIEKQFDIIRTLVAIGIALSFALIVISFISETPLEALKMFMLGPLSTVRRMGNVIEMTIPFLFTGSAVCIMYSANQINMAAEGAFFMGGIGATVIAVTMALPAGIHPFVALLFGGLLGGIIGVIPGILKVKWDAKPVVSSLMLNYISLYTGLYIINYLLRDPDSGFLSSYTFLKSANLPVIIPGTRIHAGLIFAIVVVVFTYFFLNKSKWGYAIRMVGLNENFAKYSGMSVPTVIIYSQLMGGILAGLGGATEILGMYTRFQYQSLPQFGFDGIMIAILSRYNPMYVPIASLFLAYIRVGADIMSRRTDVPIEIVAVVQAIIIILIAAEMFLEKWKHKKIVENSQKELALKEEK